MTPTLIKAKVKYTAGNPRDYGNGPRINVVAVATNGEEIKLWGSPDDAIARLQKGQQIEILQEQKGDKTIHRLLQHAEDLNQGPTTQHQNGNTNQQPTPEQLEAKFEGLLRLNAARYAKALKMAKHIIKNELGVEVQSPLQGDQTELLEPLKCIASSLFIESCRGMR